MRVFAMSLVKRGGALSLDNTVLGDFDHLVHSNIITHHAEDGSGVGSAIIAGE
jgi:hypothetical protein